MADVEALNGVAAADIEAVNGVAKANIQAINVYRVRCTQRPYIVDRHHS